MSDEYTPTDQEHARQEIEAEREAYWIDQMQWEFEIGKALGSSTRLCKEIEIEQKARGFKPTRSRKRIDELMKSCPF